MARDMEKAKPRVGIDELVGSSRESPDEGELRNIRLCTALDLELAAQNSP